MKNYLLTFIFTLTSFSMLYGQSNDSIGEIKSTVFKIDHREITTDPLYIIKIADKTINYQLNNKAIEETFLNELNPEWIESINVLKLEEGVEKYGSRAEAGVILITLKKNAWEKMTPGLQNRFM